MFRELFIILKMPRAAAFALASLLATGSMSEGASAAAIERSFASAVASHQQSTSFFWPIASAIDGGHSGANGDGWSIGANPASQTSDGTLSADGVFRLSGGFGAGTHQRLTIGIEQQFVDNSVFLIGAFELAYTTDVAPGLASSFTPLRVTDVVSASGDQSFSIGALGRGDGFVLASRAAAPLSNNDTYTVTAETDLLAADITALRLTVVDLNDDATANEAGLANGGPGFVAGGNIILTQFTAASEAFTPAAVPVPGLGIVLGACAFGLLRRRRAQR